MSAALRGKSRIRAQPRISGVLTESAAVPTVSVHGISIIAAETNIVAAGEPTLQPQPHSCPPVPGVSCQRCPNGGGCLPWPPSLRIMFPRDSSATCQRFIPFYGQITFHRDCTRLTRRGSRLAAVRDSDALSACAQVPARTSRSGELPGPERPISCARKSQSLIRWGHLISPPVISYLWIHHKY